MATLKEDIKSQSEWIVKAFGADNYILDYSMDSLMEVDRFFNDQMKDGKPKKGYRLDTPGFGPILFSIGSYVGETIIKNTTGSSWVTDDDDPKGELTVSLKLPNGGEIWPIQKVTKRFQNGSEDAIYPYAHTFTKEFTKLPFNDKYWTLHSENTEPAKIKPWWKVW
jgi:hypothetical protein